MEMTMNDNALNIWRKVLSVCKTADYSQVVVTFDGCGDSGQIESIDFQFNATMPSIHPATFSIGVFDVREGSTHRNGRWEPLIKQKELTLEDALEIITYEILNENIAGWEINEGTFGTITYSIATSAIKCNFNTRVFEENMFTFTDETEEV